jgi:hypothetical protein
MFVGRKQLAEEIRIKRGIRINYQLCRRGVAAEHMHNVQITVRAALWQRGEGTFVICICD